MLQMPRDPHNNRSKGYGFVTFEDFDSMEKAINKVGYNGDVHKGLNTPYC